MKPLSEPWYPVDVGGAIMEVSTPIRIEIFHHMIQKELCIDFQMILLSKGETCVSKMVQGIELD